MIVLLMFALVLAIATAQQRAIGYASAIAPRVKRWGGRILILVGTWFVALGIFAGFFTRVFPV